PGERLGQRVLFLRPVQPDGPDVTLVGHLHELGHLASCPRPPRAQHSRTFRAEAPGSGRAAFDMAWTCARTAGGHFPLPRKRLPKPWAGRRLPRSEAPGAKRRLDPFASRFVHVMLIGHRAPRTTREETSRRW